MGEQIGWEARKLKSSKLKAGREEQEKFRQDEQDQQEFVKI
jgi:hypothetical protein